MLIRSKKVKSAMGQREVKGMGEKGRRRNIDSKREVNGRKEKS